MPLVQAVEAVEVQELPEGQGKHSAAPALGWNWVGAVQVVAVLAGFPQAVPAAQVVQLN